MAGTSVDNPDVIRNSSSVLLLMPSGNSKIIKISDTQITLGKFGTFNASQLVGCYYEQQYEITANGIIPATKLNYEFDSTDNNNQFITDDASSQKLSQKEIESMKKKSLAGSATHQEIIKSLVENNEAFSKKTHFAQQKYIERKERK